VQRGGGGEARQLGPRSGVSVCESYIKKVL